MNISNFQTHHGTALYWVPAVMLFTGPVAWDGSEPDYIRDYTERDSVAHASVTFYL